MHSEDMYAPESIELLQKAGVDLQRHEEIGIEPDDFAELMITSGMVLSDETVWVAFHSCAASSTPALSSPSLISVNSGYDFGHIVNLLTGSPLPAQEDAFFDILKTWFPHTLDVKSIVKAAQPDTKGGLQALADDLQIPRVGPSHTAGSDSLLTAAAFFKARGMYYAGRDFPAEEFNARLYGFGPTVVLQNGVGEAARSGATLAERDDRAPGAAAAAAAAHAPPGVTASQLGVSLGGMGVGAGMPPMGPPPGFAPMGGAGAFMRR